MSLYFETKRIFVTAIFTLTIIISAHAANPENGFDIGLAQDNLTKIEQQLVVNNQDINQLVTAVGQLTELKNKANSCVDKAKNRIHALKSLMESAEKELGFKSAKNKWRHIEREIEMLSDRGVDCKILMFQMDEVISAHNKKIGLLTATKTMTKKTHYMYLANLQNIKQFHFDSQIALSYSGLSELSPSKIVALLMWAILSAVAAKYITDPLHKLKAYYSKSNRLYAFFIHHIAAFLIPIMSLGVILIYLSVIYSDLQEYPILYQHMWTIFLMTGSLLISNIILLRPNHRKSILKIKSKTRKIIIRRLRPVIVFTALAYMLDTLTMGQFVPENFRGAWVSLFVIITSIMLLFVVWPVTNPNAMQYNLKSVRVMIRTIVVGIILVIAVCESLGYHPFALFIIKAVTLTMVIAAIFFELFKVIEMIFDYLDSPTSLWPIKIRESLGVFDKDSPVEFYFFRICIYVPLVFYTSTLLLNAWHVSPEFISLITHKFIKGFSVAEMTIVPLRIVFGLMAFSFIMLFVRYITTRISNRLNKTGERDSQVAVAALLTYIGFTFAVIVGMLFAGVNFTGLAIVAGALSVGIGFGLQHIASNFISGILLLIQTPVKAGDRVIVAGKEGFVKRVNLLSTQIRTLKKEDVIVPNADLITQPVTNYMFHDNFGRVINSVGVAYGSEVEKVIKTLLEIANAHPEVVKSGRDKPVVFFTEFGSSALNFELWSVVRNVNIRYRIQTELNIAIDKLFKTQNITIAFPQLDVHVKSQMQLAENI